MTTAIAIIYSYGIITFAGIANAAAIASIGIAATSICNH